MLLDTAREQERRYFALLAAQPPLTRLRRAVSLSRTVRRMAVAGLRARHPGADPVELRVRLAVVLYGRSVAERLFANVPSDAR